MAHKDPEKRKEYAKRWYADNKERILARFKVYRETHKEQSKQAQKAWREANSERVNALSKKHIKAHIDTLSDYYVNLQIRKGTSLKSKDIPKGLTEAKRVAILIERELRESLPKGRRNPEKRKEYMQAYGAAWRERNKEYIQEKGKLYRQTHKERRNELNRLYRARAKAKKQLTNQEGVAK